MVQGHLFLRLRLRSSERDRISVVSTYVTCVILTDIVQDSSHRQEATTVSYIVQMVGMHEKEIVFRLAIGISRMQFISIRVCALSRALSE